MKPSYLLIICLNSFILSCSKKETALNNVQIRIRNNSSTSFINVVSSNAAYGVVNTGNTTGYKLFKEAVIAYPGAMVYTDRDSSYAGLFYCGTPPLPYLENGRYTLVIKDGAVNTNPKFTTEFVKD